MKSALFAILALTSGCIDRHPQADPDDPDPPADVGADRALDPPDGAPPEPDGAPDAQLPPVDMDPPIPDVVVQIADDDAYPIQFSADGRVLLFRRSDRYWLHHLATGAQVGLDAGPPGFVALSPDGRTVLWMQPGQEGPRPGISIWSPGDPASLVELPRALPHGQFLAGGRFTAQYGVVFHRVDPADLVEVLRVDGYQFTQYQPAPDAATHLMVTSRAEEGSAAWLIDLEAARARPLHDQARFLAWSGRYLVYREGAGGAFLALDRGDGRVLGLSDSTGHAIVTSAHDPPIAAVTSAGGSWLQRFGARDRRALSPERQALLGWVGDEIFLQTVDEGPLEAVDAITGERRIIDDAPGRRYWFSRDRRYLRAYVERDGARHHERFEWATGARVEVSGPGPIAETAHPDVYLAGRDSNTLIRIRGDRVEGRMVQVVTASSDGGLLGLRDGDALSALDLATLREHPLYPADLPVGPLREYLLGRGVFALRLGEDGASSLWVGPVR